MARHEPVLRPLKLEPIPLGPYRRGLLNTTFTGYFSDGVFTISGGGSRVDLGGAHSRLSPPGGEGLRRCGEE